MGTSDPLTVTYRVKFNKKENNNTNEAICFQEGGRKGIEKEIKGEINNIRKHK